MAECSLCGREMLSAEGCIEHNVMLRDGTVIPSPIHGEEGSLHEAGERCHDCGAEPGGVHHVRCDSARQPDGSQILIEASCYFDPDRHIDPRSRESDYVFVVVMQESEHSDRDPVAAFQTYDATEQFREHEDWGEFDVRALEAKAGYLPREH